MADSVIKCTVQIYNVRRYKNDWCLANGEVTQCKEKSVKVGSVLNLKGVMPQIYDGNLYNILAEEEDDNRWGLQYNVRGIFAAVTFDKEDHVGQKKFLSSIFTPFQINNMYDSLDNPYQTLLDADVVSLMNVKGCGLKTANSWITKFNEHFCKAKIYVELEKYNLTNGIIDKLLDRYNSPEIVIEKVKENPYTLCNDVKGIGWKTADKIALEGGMNEFDPIRISASIIHILEEKGEAGCSWITPDELMGEILEALGDEVPDEPISIALKQLIDDEVVWHSDDKTQIGLKHYYDLEFKVAQELIRLRDAQSSIEAPDWQDDIKHLEHKQGWQFTEEQINGIKMGLENNVTVITGRAGSGKSSLVSGILAALSKYTFVQAALSGRAGARMQEITGKEGFTIHRLLGYPAKKGEGKNGFTFSDENHLPYDIYIFDEISMIDAWLFYCALRAIPDGSKIYLLGDYAQLESIGSGNIAYDMINSSEIPTTKLTKIHRQAAKSAIITESIKVSDGVQLIPKDWVGTEVRGELQDLSITCFSDVSNTYYEIMKQFSNLYNSQGFDPMETQIIVPVKSRGAACTYELNNSLQLLCNEQNKSKNEYVCFNAGKSYILREGDKVINTVNNYRTNPAIYNGNIGIIKEIYEDAAEPRESYMLIEFLGIGSVYLEKKYWNNIELAYAITGHKYQGSQADTIIVGVDFSAYALLTREWVYTAITRAKKKCYLVAQTGALRFATAKQSVSTKQTHLQQCLHDLAHPKLIF